MQDLISDIYGDLRGDPEARKPDKLMCRAILTPKNSDTDALNEVRSNYYYYRCSIS